MGNSVNVIRFLRGYLAREWQDCYWGKAAECDAALSYDPERLRAKFIREIPVQQNDSDCGIFVLEFTLQLFLKPSMLLNLVMEQSPIFQAQNWEVPALPRNRWRRAAAHLQTEGNDGNWLDAVLTTEVDSA